MGANFFVHDAPEIDPVREDKLHQRLAPYFEELGIEPPDTLTIPQRFDETMLEAVLSVRPAVVSFHFGLPRASVMDALKSSGAMVMSSATTVAEARQLEVGGADPSSRRAM